MRRKRGIRKGQKFGIAVIRAMSEKDWDRYKLDVSVVVFKPEVIKEEEIPMLCYWEVMYQYLNPEVSLAYPQHIFPKDKIGGRAYYGTKSACQRMCNVINNVKRPTYFGYKVINGF